MRRPTGRSCKGCSQSPISSSGCSASPLSACRGTALLAEIDQRWPHIKAAAEPAGPRLGERRGSRGWANVRGRRGNISTGARGARNDAIAAAGMAAAIAAAAASEGEPPSPQRVLRAPTTAAKTNTTETTRTPGTTRRHPRQTRRSVRVRRSGTAAHCPDLPSVAWAARCLAFVPTRRTCEHVASGRRGAGGGWGRAQPKRELPELTADAVEYARTRAARSSAAATCLSCALNLGSNREAAQRRLDEAIKLLAGLQGELDAKEAFKRQMCEEVVKLNLVPGGRRCARRLETQERSSHGSLSQAEISLEETQRRRSRQ